MTEKKPRFTNVALQTVKVRDALKPRREPYWGPPITRGQFVGLRKIDGAPATWIARYRDEDKQQHYKSLGPLTPAYDYNRAKADATAWIKLLSSGVKTGEVETVEAACRAYVAERRTSKGEKTAHDAEKRFERTVYDNPFGQRHLSKIQAKHLRDWRDGLGLKPAASNRTMTALKAALHLAITDKHAPPALREELRSLKPLKGAHARRELCLDRKQRRALRRAAKGAARDLIVAATLTGARAGELVSAKVAAFSEDRKTLALSGKTGARTIALGRGALALFKRRAKGKGADELLLTRDDGKPWAHSDWDELVRDAATVAKLPKGVCLYTLRHSFITEALKAKRPPHAVAFYCGTSLLMIQKNYGHVDDEAARQIANVAML
jgi:site-specific recombinase XerD